MHIIFPFCSYAGLLTYIHLPGASSSNVMQTTRTLHSPDGEIIVKRTKIMFTFHHPYDHSPYRPPLGSAIEERTMALLRGEWPLPYSNDSSRPATPANSIRHPSPITISTATSRSSSPLVYVEDTAPGNLPALAEPFDFDKVANARRDRRARKKAIPPAERWYAVTRGLCVGAMQGV